MYESDLYMSLVVDGFMQRKGRLVLTANYL